MRSTNLYLMSGTTVIEQVMQLSDLLRSTNGHPELRRLSPKHQQVVRTILTEELNFQREQLNKLLTMVSS